MKIRLNTGIRAGGYIAFILLLFTGLGFSVLYGYYKLAGWLSISGILLCIIGGILFYFGITKPLIRIRRNLISLSKGIIPEVSKPARENDISGIENAFAMHVERIKQMVEYSKKLADGEMDEPFAPVDTRDEMGSVLIILRDSLLKQREETGKRQEEDEQRNWAARGLTMFNDILREAGDDVSKLSYSFIKGLVKYVSVEAGGLYLVEEGKRQEGQKVLLLTGSYAFDREKYLDTEIMFGEGLVGRTAVEGKMIYLTDIPGSYLKIRSGLGEDNPVSLLFVPVVQSGEVLGVIELAAFSPMPEYKINFVCSLGDSIGSIISKVFVNIKTGKLLQQSQQQTEELATREEEMRQKMEELRLLQEQSSLREKELAGQLSELKKQVSGS